MTLTVQNLFFEYNELKKILMNIDFKYESPEILCILGTNGTGKSTLLECISGHNHNYKGNIFINEKELMQISPREFATRVAYLPQSHEISFGFRVIDVVLMGRTSHMGHFATPGPNDYKIAMEKLEFLNINRLENMLYTEISGGERQLVMIAAALAQEPELIILDEPTSHLDFGNQFRLVKLLKKLNANGLGIIMTTHFPDHALQLGGQTIILQNGTIIQNGTAKEVITEKNMSELYGIKIKIEFISGKYTCIPIE